MLSNRIILSKSFAHDLIDGENELATDLVDGSSFALMSDNVENPLPAASIGALTDLATNTLASAPVGPTPNLTFTWVGVTQAQAGSTPADSDIAAGTNSIITVVTGAGDDSDPNSTGGGHIDIYNKTGEQHLSGETLQEFFNLPPKNFVFDPTVTWDQYIGRFIVVAVEQTGSNSDLLIAVSKDSNPLDGWFTYDFNVKNANMFLDRPIVGLDSTTLYISGNYFNLVTEQFNHPALWAFDIKALATNQPQTGHSYPASDLGLSTFFAPAHMYGSEPGLNGNFLVSYFHHDSGDDTLDITQVSNAAQGNQTHNFQPLDVGDINADPSGARQPHSSTLINDGSTAEQTLNAVWSNDKLYAVNEIRIGSGPNAHDVVHWFVVDTNDLNHLQLLSQGNVDFGSSLDTYFGNLTVDSAGNMIIGYSYSGPTAFAGAAYAVIPAGETAPQDSGVVALAPGQGTYSDNSGAEQYRWGDYSGVAIDPDGQSFWVFNEYATNQTTPNNWATQIGGFHVPSLYALPITTTDLMTLQQGIQAFTNSSEATQEFKSINEVPATETVASYASQLIDNNQALSQVAMAVDALMFGAVDTVAEFNKLSTEFLPSQMAAAVQFRFNPTVYDAEALGLGLAGGNGTSNAFETNFGNLDVSAFAQAASIAVFGNANLAGTITTFANNWIAFYTANPAAHPGLSVTLASYGAAFGDSVGLALANPMTVGTKLFESVSNALILNAEGLILVGTALDKQPLHNPLQGETIATTSFVGDPVGVGSDTVDLIGLPMTSLASHSSLFA